MIRLGLDWPVSSYTGWGLFGLHLCLSLIRRKSAQPVLFHPPQVELQTAQRKLFANVEVQPLPAGRRVDFPVLHALGNGLKDFGLAEGTDDAGLIFFEDPQSLDGAARERAEKYRIIVAGSQWNGALLRQSGITNVVVAQQGYDDSVFYPGPGPERWPGRFAVFSGGKLERRKAQDLVLRVFAAFHARHPEALLVTAWHGFDRQNDFGVTDVPAWVAGFGIPQDAVVDIGFIPNRLLGDVLRSCTAALFPNRCEGGTNLMAMEALGTGLPSILSANTGHLDLTTHVPCWTVGGDPIRESLACLEEIHADPKAARLRGLEAARAMQANWTWTQRAARVAEVLGY